MPAAVPPTFSAQPPLTGTVLLVRPVAFGFNPETAMTNAFQKRPNADLGAEPNAKSKSEIAAQALAEFDAFAAQLRGAGLRVIVFQDPGSPSTPDSIFPNNWVSFHGGGRAVLYPMHAPNRRAERRLAVFELLTAEGFSYPSILDLSAAETRGEFLEGTGSLVLDRVRRVAFAAVSPRTHLAVAQAWAAALGYELFLFTALDAANTPIYHTNVLLSVGETVAVACFDALPDPAERAALRARLAEGGRLVLPISLEQLAAFAGNMLQVQPAGRGALLILSAQAWASLTTSQQSALHGRTGLLVAPLDMIERAGGGSARCMLAEVF